VALEDWLALGIELEVTLEVTKKELRLSIELYDDVRLWTLDSAELATDELTTTLSAEELLMDAGAE
jgi:hypothetical protein